MSEIDRSFLYKGPIISIMRGDRLSKYSMISTKTNLSPIEGFGHPIKPRLQAVFLVCGA